MKHSKLALSTLVITALFGLSLVGCDNAYEPKTQSSQVENSDDPKLTETVPPAEEKSEKTWERVTLPAGEAASTPNELKVLLILDGELNPQNPIYLSFENRFDDNTRQYEKAHFGFEDNWFGDDLNEWIGNETVYHTGLTLRLDTFTATGSYTPGIGNRSNTEIARLIRFGRHEYGIELLVPHYVKGDLFKFNPFGEVSDSVLP